MMRKSQQNTFLFVHLNTHSTCILEVHYASHSPTSPSSANKSKSAFTNFGIHACKACAQQKIPNIL